MANRCGPFTVFMLILLASGQGLLMRSASGEDPNTQPPRAPPDAIADAQTPKEAPAERPEQRKTAHDLSDIFAPSRARHPRRPWPTSRSAAA